MFKAIAKILSAREAPKAGFIPPDNRHTGSAPEFREHLLSLGFTKEEVSQVMVKRFLAVTWYLESRGYSFSQILDMDPSRHLATPTNERDYYDYCRISREKFERARLARACGLH